MQNFLFAAMAIVSASALSLCAWNLHDPSVDGKVISPETFNLIFDRAAEINAHKKEAGQMPTASYDLD